MTRSHISPRITPLASVPWRAPRACALTAARRGAGGDLPERSDELAVSVPLQRGDGFLIADAVSEAEELVMTLPLDWADVGAATEIVRATISAGSQGAGGSLRNVHWWTSGGGYLSSFAGTLAMTSDTEAREPATRLVLQGAYALPLWALDFEANAMLAHRIAVFAAHALLAEIAKRLLVRAHLLAGAPDAARLR